MADSPFDRMLNAAVQAARMEADDVLQPLEEYDRRHGGDLVHTLTIYLYCGCNASRAAETLYLHRSSLLYRLRRIEHLLHARLTTFTTRVGLELAILARIGRAAGDD